MSQRPPNTTPEQLLRAGAARRVLNTSMGAGAGAVVAPALHAEALRQVGRLAEAREIANGAGTAGAAVRARIALDLGEVVEPDPALPPLLQAEFLLRRGEAAAARAAATAVVRAARAVDDGELEDDALTLVGRSLVELRDYARARPILLDALQRHERRGCRPGMVDCLGALGLVSLGLAETSRGAQRLTQAAALAAELDLLPLEAAWRVHLDHALVLLERMEWRARELRRFIEVVAQLGRPAWEASLWCELGHTLRSVRDARGARDAYARALALSRHREDPLAISVDLTNLGRVHLDLGAWSEARALLEEALQVGPADAPHLQAARAVLDGWIYDSDAPAGPPKEAQRARLTG
jgi:tetratricopeptide (TPR) repeat protein